MTRVIKVGGRPQTHPSLPAALVEVYRAEPGTLVVVHGGGDEVSTLQALYGAKSDFKGGRRVTSQLDLDIVRMALSGAANKRLVSALVTAGIPALGLSGEDAGLMLATPTNPAEYGLVGTPARVDQQLIRYLLDGGYLPVISPVSRSTDLSLSAVLNVNGDDAAAKIATALAADELLLVSDVAGVLVDGVVIPELSSEDIHRLINDGTAKGGMGAKLQAAFAALESGVERVRISDIAAIRQPDRGTLLTRARSECV